MNKLSVVLLLYVGLDCMVGCGCGWIYPEGRNGIFDLREETGGDPEQREPLLAVGDSPDSTTASPFLTFGLISLSLTT